ncbi:hypothetical protein PCANC_27248 [Puccinia coronata f. sp. avenae]|uniref:Retrotransposon gag domain-containing protein n=1 Tax=Puccinia coronata f. sp. avenae TaxID=200324 RepID=A0A2N5TLI5_9BASI|nr:hypothetical protein PCANC_27248 [Puccinia coronata f. sp. avenae]
MAFQTEIIKLHNIINSTEQQLTNADQGVNQRFEQLDNCLLDLHVSTANLSGPKGILDVPVHLHINFAGLPKETYQFVFFIQEALITSAGRFADEKQKIMWIASFFHQKGSNVEGCLSHNWWQGLLRKNAAAQGLPTVNASSHAPYVIDELKSAQLFITALEATFTNHREAEESREKLQRIRQTRDQSIEEFNIIFNVLLFMVDMDSVSKCNLYQSAVNPIIHELGIMQGGWASIKDLESKQAMAVQLYHDDEGMKLAEQIKKASNSSHAPLRIEHKINPSQHSTSIPQSKVVDSSPASDPMAMDLDSIVAEMKFSYAKLAGSNEKKYCEAVIEGAEEKKHYKLNAATIATLSSGPDEHTSKKRACETPTPALFLTDAVNAAKIVNAAGPIYSSTPSIPTSSFPQNLNPIQFSTNQSNEDLAAMSIEPMSLADQLLDSHLAELDEL